MYACMCMYTYQNHFKDCMKPEVQIMTLLLLTDIYTDFWYECVCTCSLGQGNHSLGQWPEMEISEN